jgi:hypothetical protein
MELMMTTPYERTKAVTDTRELLQMLSSAKQINIDGLVQSVALGLLRHFCARRVCLTLVRRIGLF